MHESTIASLVTAINRMVLGFRAARPDDTLLTPQLHTTLAAASERLPEHSAAVAEALETLARYRATDENETRFWRDMRWSDCKREITAFLQRSRVYDAVWRGETPDVRQLLAQFDVETSATECDVTHVIPIDGLAIRGSSPILLPGGARLVEFSAGEWDAFFEAPLYPAPDNSEFNGFWAIERRLREDLAPNPIRFWLEPPLKTAISLVGRWLPFLNLISAGFVRPLAIYSKQHTQLAKEPVETRRIGSPLTLSRTDSEGAEYDEPFVSVDVSAEELTRFVEGVDTGRLAATSRGHRVETALHWFGRVTDSLYGWEPGLGSDESLLEAIIPDCFTALEAALLRPDERSGKGSKIALRTASLVADSDTTRDSIRADVEAAYRHRNSLVHGDVRPPLDELRGTAKHLRVWVKQVMVAMLRLGGDLDRMVAGATDESVRVKNRALVPVYEEDV